MGPACSPGATGHAGQKNTSKGSPDYLENLNFMGAILVPSRAVATGVAEGLRRHPQRSAAWAQPAPGATGMQAKEYLEVLARLS
eukprot:2281700-Amphidinium_carterae.1